MSRNVVFLAGSPSPTSRSTFVQSEIASHVERAGFTPRVFTLNDFDASDVLFARTAAPSIAAFLDVVKGAAGIVLSTPVYKATYAGGLKAIVDLLPPDALTGRPALGIATTRLELHGAGVGAAYDALFAFFGARLIPSLVVLDAEAQIDAGIGALEPAARARVDASARALVAALTSA